MISQLHHNKKPSEFCFSEKMIKMTKPNFYVKNVDLEHCYNPALIRNILNKVQKEHKADMKGAQSVTSSFEIKERL